MAKKAKVTQDDDAIDAAEIESDEVNEPQGPSSDDDIKSANTPYTMNIIEVEMGGEDQLGIDGGAAEESEGDFSKYEEIDESSPKQKAKLQINEGDDDLSVNQSDRDDFLPDASASIDPEDRIWGKD